MSNILTRYINITNIGVIMNTEALNLNQYLDKYDVGQEVFAGRVGRSQGRISQWLRTGVTSNMAIPVETASNGIVPRYISSPEMYPPEQYRMIYPLLFRLLYSDPAVNNNSNLAGIEGET